MHRLRELRKFNKLSARELGSILGYAESTILQWERGTRAPDASALLTIANHFNVSLDYLLERKHYESVIEAIGSYAAGNLVRIPLLEEYPQFINDEVYYKSIKSVDISPLILGKIEYPFAIIAKDDLMTPTIQKDDLVILGVSKDINENDIVLFFANNEVKLGRLNFFEKHMLFTFDKVGVHPLAEKLDDKKIVAKVVEIRRFIK